MGLILSAILSLGKDVGRTLWLLLRQAVLVGRVIKGNLVSMILIEGKSLLLEVALMSVVFLLLNTALHALIALGSYATSWLSTVESVQALTPSGYHGVLSLAWESLALDHFFNSVVTVFSAWLSGWSVYKTMEFQVVVRRFGAASGFWRRLV